VSTPSVLWGFFHTTCIYESAAALISLHLTKATAWRAMHKAQWEAWVALQQRQGTPRNWRVGSRERGRKAYVYERSFINSVEVLP
jgi:hypothetical protein